MVAEFRFFSALIALLVLLWPALGAAQAPAACPADATGLADGARLSCTCAGGASGGVYGSIRYTADSSICTAAVHAGKVPAAGGTVDIVVGGACPAFPGTAANGVTTSSWSNYDKSFGFGATLPACATTAEAAKPAAPSATGGVQNCPSFVTQSDKSKPGDSLTCICDIAIDFNTGAAYGTDRYSNDSSICIAAKHAGKLPQPGGMVTVHVAEGCGKLEGTTRNGITTRSWSSTVPGTITFVTPVPACAAPLPHPLRQRLRLRRQGPARWRPWRRAPRPTPRHCRNPCPAGRRSHRQCACRTRRWRAAR